MKRKTFLYLASLLILVGCDYNDKYFDGLDDLARPSNIGAITYTLLDEDYATIAKNSTNKALAEAAGVTAELNSLATTKRFSETLPVSLYAPAFIANKWYTVDNSSSVKLTYNAYVNVPEYVQKLNTASIYKLGAADYESVWGSGAGINFFTPLTSAAANVPGILLTARPEAVAGDLVAVDYNQSENEPGGAVVPINENFESLTAYDDVELDGWHNVTTVGTVRWQVRYLASASNTFANVTANGHAAGALETYLITPKISITQGMNLTFDACYGYYKAAGGRVTVLVSTNLAGFTPAEFNAATWTDITSSFDIPIPSGNYGTLGYVGSHNLNLYAGQQIYIAFRYNGDGTADATTTVQLDNVVVKSEPDSGGEDKYTATTGLFRFNGTAWAAYSDNTYMMKLADYQSMGLQYDNFSSSLNPDLYLPLFLKQKYPYAQADAQVAVAYKYYVSSTSTVIRADEYIYSGTEWVKNSGVEEATDQFVLSNGKWNYDPSVVITLLPVRSNAESAKYYQAIVDYVGATHGTGYFQIGYTNAEYYYGASAYQNNLDLRVSAWRGSHANGSVYSNFSDTELEALMYERLKEAFIPALKKNHSDLKPIDGLDVLCTIRFAIYKGSTVAAPTHTIQYKVTAPAEFEYVEDSFQAL